MLTGGPFSTQSHLKLLRSLTPAWRPSARLRPQLFPGDAHAQQLDTCRRDRTLNGTRERFLAASSFPCLAHVVLAGLCAALACSEARADKSGGELEMIHEDASMSGVVSSIVPATVLTDSGTFRKVLFVSVMNSNNQDHRLWATDGTASGTWLVSTAPVASWNNAVWRAPSHGVYIRTQDSLGVPAIMHAWSFKGPATQVMVSTSLPPASARVQTVGPRLVEEVMDGGIVWARVHDLIEQTIDQVPTNDQFPIGESAGTNSTYFFSTRSGPISLNALDVPSMTLRRLQPLYPQTAWGHIFRLTAADTFVCGTDYLATGHNYYSAAVVCSDGSDSGTVRLAPPGSIAIRMPGFHRPTSLGSRVLFDGQLMGPDGGISGPRLWGTDGTNAGTESLFGDRWVGSFRFCSKPQDGEMLVHLGTVLSNNTESIWRTDGTAAGTSTFAKYLRTEPSSAQCSGQGAVFPDGSGALLSFGSSGLHRVGFRSHTPPQALEDGPSTVSLIYRVNDAIVMLGPSPEGAMAFWRYVPDRVFAEGLD